MDGQTWAERAADQAKAFAANYPRVTVALVALVLGIVLGKLL